MALSFIKKAATNGSAGVADGKTNGTVSNTASNGSAKATNGLGGKSGIASWMKTGKAGHQAIEHADAMAEKAREEAGHLWRFWMPPDDERLVSFLDGSLDSDGLLDVPMFHEHRLKINGDFQNYVCTADQEPCPICEAGDSKAMLVGVFTVIDHTPYKVKSGPNAGKTIQHSRKLFVATRQTIKKLTPKGVKQGGLAGVTFTIRRTGDKEPGVGSDFEFEQKRSLAEIAKACNLKLEDVQPANYAEEIAYRTAAELVALGVGKAIKGIGHEAGVDTMALHIEL